MSEYIYEINNELIRFRGFNKAQLKQELKRHNEPKSVGEIKEKEGIFHKWLGHKMRDIILYKDKIIVERGEGR